MSIIEIVEGVNKIIKTTEETVKDVVNSPKHYQLFSELGIEAIHVAQSVLTPEEFLGALKFNVIKYVLRADKKNREEDWKKIYKYSGWVTEYIETGTITVNERFKVKPKE